MANLAGPLVPVDADTQPRTWRHYYTDQELRHGRRLRILNFLGLPFFGALYFSIAYTMEVLSAPPKVCQDAEYAEPPLFVLVIQGVLAVVGLFAFSLSTSLLPPNISEDLYHVQKYIGGWVFLTRHCLILQSVHLVVTFVASVGHFAFLACMTNSIALVIGALGLFVTIQYFSLVHNHPEFVGMCEERMKRDPPDNCRKKNFWLHAFALPLAVLDITISRNHKALHLESSLPICLGTQSFYCLYYLAWIFGNFGCTGYWPYEFLKELKTLAAWAKFFFMQSFIMCVFCTMLWVLSLLPSIW
mmetsp:Transcript_44248/g.85060  ORF Transcript_44248/g.85060 Transcript_44248/m.85060 type:complete len:301 (+) Transcript_44248:46-948(+)